MTPQQIWQAVLAELELSLSKANFTTWFKKTAMGAFENGEAIISIPSTFYRTWIEKKFHSQLVKLIEKVAGQPVRSLIFRVDTAPAFSPPPYPLSHQETTEIGQISQSNLPESVNVFGLNPRYTFDSFVVGKGNELAHAGSQAVVAQPGHAYNPLFIYGGAGLGKTHLLQAIGNQILRQDRKKRLVYATCEKFTNEFIQAVKTKQIETFHHTYRKADVLLIDDIQFIAGKTETQEAFFNAFNDLHQQDKQIVITSDRPPKAIPLLEHRLLTRFEMGMIADIATPELETRIAILEKKCQEKRFCLEKEVIDFLAASIRNNVRELEGALNKLMAYYLLKKTPPTVELARALIAHLESSAPKRVITPKHIIQIVAEFYDLKLEELLGKSREKRLSFPRQIIMFLMREELRSSFPSIGFEVGHRDHTTAMHACDKIKNEFEKIAKTREEIFQIRQRLFAA